MLPPPPPPLPELPPQEILKIIRVRSASNPIARISELRAFPDDIPSTRMPTLLIDSPSIICMPRCDAIGRVATEIVSVAGVPAADAFTEAGVNPHVVPAGLVQLSVTASAKPF